MRSLCNMDQLNPLKFRRGFNDQAVANTVWNPENQLEFLMACKLYVFTYIYVVSFYRYVFIFIVFINTGMYIYIIGCFFHISCKWKNVPVYILGTSLCRLYTWKVGQKVTVLFRKKCGRSEYLWISPLFFFANSYYVFLRTHRFT